MLLIILSVGFAVWLDERMREEIQPVNSGTHVLLQKELQKVKAAWWDGFSHILREGYFADLYGLFQLLSIRGDEWREANYQFEHDYSNWP